MRSYAVATIYKTGRIEAKKYFILESFISEKLKKSKIITSMDMKDNNCNGNSVNLCRKKVRGKYRAQVEYHAIRENWSAFFIRRIIQHLTYNIETLRFFEYN